MLSSLLRSILRRSAPREPEKARSALAGTLRLHIGGERPHSDWKILNVQAGSHVDFVGSCTDLSQFAAGSVADIYASHVLEHLGYLQELPAALTEFNRVLVSGGRVYASVPDLEVLAQLYLDPALSVEERFHVMRMMYGGQVDGHDYHRVGLNWDLLRRYLLDAGFREIRRVERLGVFDDTSNTMFRDRLISVNVIATK